MIFFFKKKKRICKININFSVSSRPMSYTLLFFLLILSLFCHLFIHIGYLVFVIDVKLIVDLGMITMVFAKGSRFVRLRLKVT